MISLHHDDEQCKISRFSLGPCGHCKHRTCNGIGMLARRWPDIVPQPSSKVCKATVCFAWNKTNCTTTRLRILLLCWTDFYRRHSSLLRVIFLLSAKVHINPYIICSHWLVTASRLAHQVQRAVLEQSLCFVTSPYIRLLISHVGKIPCIFPCIYLRWIFPCIYLPAGFAVSG